MPAAPVAKASTVSLVEVSPSTVMQEKLRALAPVIARCRNAGSTAASVKMKPSIVAMSGAIIPEPLMIPTSVTGRPSTTAVVTAPLAKVSVVMIVAAASSHPHGSAAKAASSPASALSMGSGTPITPVDATNTSDGTHPIADAARAAIASTAARPRCPVNALEFPAFTTSARACPSTSACRHHSTSGDGHRLLVSTPATLVPSARVTNVRSHRSHALYRARATRRPTPAMAGMAGKGRARGDAFMAPTYAVPRSGQDGGILDVPCRMKCIGAGDT